MSTLSSCVRSVLIAAMSVASLSSAAVAVPVFPNLDPAVNGSSGPNQPILVWGGEGRDHGPGFGRILPRFGGRHGGGGWGGRGHWGHGGGWGGWGPGFALGLGLGLPFGYYGGGGYAPYYDDPGYYDEPIYRPRAYRPRAYRPRVYRPRVYYAPRYYQNYNSYNGFYQCDNAYQTGPVRTTCR